MKRGKIILLSGASSSGKSTLAEGLQKALDEPFLHLQLDDFIKMLPRNDDWEMFCRMVSGMNRSIAALAGEGNNLIVDHVLIDNDWLNQCLDVLREFYVLFVGVDCPLEELERREKIRDARRQGFARQQFENIHKGKIYDVKVNTFEASAEKCTEKVIEFYRNETPNAFQRMRIENGEN
jgi:chloramphenicol 3-O phosphotransferase